MIRKRYLFAVTIILASLIIAASMPRGLSLIEITASLNSVSTTRGELDTFLAIAPHSSVGFDQLGRRTLFVPNDAAFEAYFERTGTTLDTLIEDPETIDLIVNSHLIRGARTASQLERPSRLNTIGRTTILVEDSVLTQGTLSARIIRPDAHAGNGIVHVIDGVLI